MEGQKLVAVGRRVERRLRVAHRYPHRLAGVHVRTLGGCVARRRLEVDKYREDQLIVTWIIVQIA